MLASSRPTLEYSRAAVVAARQARSSSQHVILRVAVDTPAAGRDRSHRLSVRGGQESPHRIRVAARNFSLYCEYNVPSLPSRFGPCTFRPTDVAVVDRCLWWGLTAEQAPPGPRRLPPAAAPLAAPLAALARTPSKGFEARLCRRCEACVCR